MYIEGPVLFDHWIMWMLKNNPTPIIIIVASVLIVFNLGMILMYIFARTWSKGHMKSHYKRFAKRESTKKQMKLIDLENRNAELLKLYQNERTQKKAIINHLYSTIEIGRLDSGDIGEIITESVPHKKLK